MRRTLCLLAALLGGFLLPAGFAQSSQNNFPISSAAERNQQASCVADTGAADVYVMTLPSVPSAYASLQRFCFKAVNANLTTTPTLNVNGLGAKTITKNGGAVLAASDIKAGQIVDVEYDGTNFQMQSTLGNGGGGGAPSGSAGGDLCSTYPNPTVCAAHWTQAVVNFAASPYTVLATDSSLNVTAVAGNVAMNLPAATGSGKEYFFVKTDSGANTVVVNRAGADTIEGATSVTLATQYDSLLIRDAAAGSWIRVSPKVPGSNGQLFYNANSIPGGLTSSTVDVLTTVASANSNIIGLNRTYTAAGGSFAAHAFDCTLDYTGTFKINTHACFYGSLKFTGSGGGGHIGGAFFRVYNQGTNGGGGATVDELDGVYVDMQNVGTDVTTVTESTGFSMLTSTFAGGAGNTYSNHAGFRYRTASWSSPTVATIEQAFVSQIPTSANAQLITFHGLRLGGCVKASVYAAMCIDGGASYFKQGIDQTLTFDQTIAAPLTTGGILTSSESAGIHQSNFIGTNITGANIQGLLTGQTGNTGATMIGVDMVVDNGGNSTPSLDAVYRGQLKNSGAGVVTKGIVFSAIAPQNSSTYTDISGFECADLNVATVTNTPQCLKQSGATNINTMAGITFTNGNVARVTADFTDSSSTALQAITGLTWTFPKNTATNSPFECHIQYDQTVGTATVAFGIQSVTISPTNINAQGEIYTAAGVVSQGNLQTLTTTTATNIVTGTPSATTTIFNADLYGMLELPSNASANVVNIMVSQSTAADLVVIKRGSYCKLF